MSIHPGRSYPGERNGWAKLTDAQALEIRQRGSAGELVTRLAVEFGVSESTVSKIVNGHRWRHIGGPLKNSASKAAREGNQ